MAVLGDGYWPARRAIEGCPSYGTAATDRDSNSDHAYRPGQLRDALDARGAVAETNGNAATALQRSAKTLEAVYTLPFLTHATMEPMNATAVYPPDRCEIWAARKRGRRFAAVLEASGLSADVRHQHAHLGGGFGRRDETDYIRQAVVMARRMHTPIKLVWTREEDMTHGRYHPVTQCKMTAGLDADNNLTGLHMRISGQSIAFALRPAALVNGKDPSSFACLNPAVEASFAYSIPNLLIDHSMRNPHIMPWSWRGVNHNHNALYVECFIDEIAHAAGQDPLPFRRKMMAKYPKLLAVLNAVAENIGWDKPAPQGVYRGFAQHMAITATLRRRPKSP